MPAAALRDLPDVEPEQLPVVIVSPNPASTFLLRQVLELIAKAGREGFQVRRPGMLYRAKCGELGIGRIRMFADHDGFTPDDARRVQEDFEALHTKLWPRMSVLVHMYTQERQQGFIVTSPTSWPTDVTGIIGIQISISPHPTGRPTTRAEVLEILGAIDPGE